MASKTRALLICIDGADGTGKSKIAQDVVTRLNDKGISTFLTKEPHDDGMTYSLIKDLSKQYMACIDNETDRKFVNKSLILAHTLNRSIHMNSIWASLWSKDLQVIVMDRGYWSTLVYQGILAGDEETIELIDDIHDGIDIADLNFIVTCSPEEQQKRIDHRTSNDDFDKLAKEALIGYNNLVLDLSKTTRFTYSKAYQIKKRASLISLENSDGKEQNVVDYIISMVESKLKCAKYDIFGKYKDLNVIDDDDSDEL